MEDALKYSSPKTVNIGHKIQANKTNKQNKNQSKKKQTNKQTNKQTKTKQKQRNQTR